MSGPDSRPASDPGSHRESVSDRGEPELIDAIGRRLPQGRQVVVPPGDDAAVVLVDQTPIVISTDVLVCNVHFRTDWADAHDIGRRAAAATLADLVAMGSQPVALVVALVAPAETEAAWVLRLTDGLREEADQVKASIVGGDISRGAQLSLTVTGVGQLHGDPVLRSGAKVGDYVAVAGRLGWAEAGLAVLTRGFGTPRALVEAYRRPEIDYAVALKAAPGAHAMCDVSDGLLADLGHIAVASEVAIDIDTSSVEVAEPVAAVAAAYGMDPHIWVLGGGHDHAFVATFAPRKRLPRGFVKVGSVVEVSESAPRVTVDGRAWSGSTGHAHYR